MKPKKAPPLTERELVGRLRGRYEGEAGNGPSGTVIPQVRNAAGFDAGRTIDALAFHFWPSRGLLIDGFECKSSRSDWTRELENPAKADAFCGLVDRFYVIAGRADLVKVDEVPPDWGLLVPHGDGLKEAKPAAVMHADSPAVVEWAQRASQGRRAAGPRPLPPGFGRSFLVALVRQATRQIDVKPQLRAARDEGYRLGVAAGEQGVRREIERLRQLEATVREFEEALGYRIAGHRTYLGSLVGREFTTTQDIGKALRMLLDGDANLVGMRNRLNAAAREAERLAEEARERVTALDAALNPPEHACVLCGGPTRKVEPWVDARVCCDPKCATVQPAERAA